MDLKPILKKIIDSDASDLHMKVGTPPILRINGELVPMEMNKLGKEDVRIAASSLMTKKQQEAFLKEKEADFGIGIPGISRFRVNIYIQRGSIALAIRPISREIKSIEELSLPTVLNELAFSTRGLVLVTGTTGSGKSTTLASIIEDINSRSKLHIITLEDPIEYVFEPKEALIDQREVGRDFVDFHEGLRRVFRQDPDVIMIGEMRDLETISSAITAAETGHFVLATLHTQDAPGTIDRIIDIFPPYQQNQVRMQLANILVGVCSQQLVNTVDGRRVLAAEVLVANYAVRNLIKEGRPEQIRNVMATNTSDGMQLMEHSLAALFRKGRINRETAYMHAFDVKDLDRFLEE